MRTFFKLTYVDSKLFLRNFISAFFVFAFPVLMLLIFGAMYGNAPTPVFGGRGAMDVSVPGYVAALVIGTAGFLSLPIDVTVYRERGILRRYRATPVKPAMVLGSQLLVTLAATLLGTLLLGITGVIVFHLQLPANIPALVIGYLLACLSTFSTGLLLASLFKTASAVRAVGMAVYYPMMFLSGGTLPREVMPETLKRISDFIPLTYSVNLLKDLWFGNGWNLTAVIVLVGCAVVFIAASARLFRWE